MKQIQLQHQKRLNVMIRELIVKRKKQGYLSRSEENFLNLAVAMS